MQGGLTGHDQSETDTDSETPMGHASIWVQTHTICYRPVPDNDPSHFGGAAGVGHGVGAGSGAKAAAAAAAAAAAGFGAAGQALGCSAGAGYTRKGKGTSGKSSAKKKGDDLWNGNPLAALVPEHSFDEPVGFLGHLTVDGVAPEAQSPLTPMLSMKLPECVTVDDPSLEVLALLRVLHALNRHWGFLYRLVDYRPILATTDFVNTKLTAKANRQLQVRLIFKLCWEGHKKRRSSSYKGLHQIHSIVV